MCNVRRGPGVKVQVQVQVQKAMIVQQPIFFYLAHETSCAFFRRVGATQNMLRRESSFVRRLKTDHGHEAC